MDEERKSASCSTITQSEPTKYECNQRINKTNVQTTQQQNTNIIGSGPSYASGGIKNTFHGVSYQIKLSMLNIVRGLNKKYKFQVATEVEDADKFDDLIFLYDDDEVGFFQAKHKLNEDLTINEDQLLSSEGEFSIPKYFHSYLRILKQKKLEYILNNRNMTLIINTNIGIDSSVLNDFEHINSLPRLSGSKVLALGAEIERAEYYIMKKYSPLYNKLVGMLENLEPSPSVAEHLAKAVVNNKKKSINNDELFQTNREWLLRNVLDVGVEDNKKQKIYFVKFKDSFLSGSEENISVFRNTFFETYLSNKQIGKKSTTSAQDTFNDDTVKKDMLETKFKIAKDFASPKYSKNEMTESTPDRIRNFFEIVVFAVNQPNENKLGDIVEEEIGDYVGHTDTKSIASKFKLYIQDWATQKEGRYLKNEDVERQIAVWGQESLNRTRMDDIKKHKCTFEESHKVIQNLSNFLKTENKMNVLCLYERNPLLTKIKVCQVLKSFASENIGQQFLFCDIDSSIELENTYKCPVKAFSSPTCNVMFLSFKECKLHNNEKKILDRLLNIVIADQQKRLIISIPDEEKTGLNFSEELEITISSLDDFGNKFSELDEKSRKQLVEKGHFKLHGDNITGLLSEKELSPYIEDEMLLKLITSELEINDTLVVTNHMKINENQFYINRSLVPLMVGQDITKDNKFYVIREYTPENKIKNKEVVVISSNEKLFKKVCKTNANVHWLKETNEKYIWINSQGTISNLRKYIAAQDQDEHENCIPIENFSDLDKDVVLIRAIPGMGKSILLAHIAAQSKKVNTSFTVFKVNLVDYCTELYYLNEKTVTLNQAIRFAFFATHIESRQIEERKSAFNLITVQEDGSVTFFPNTSTFGHLEHLRAIVFCHLYNKKKIVLLLDGFDEIAPDYCKTTLNLLLKLKHSKVHKMWITTRPYSITKNLENILETFAYTLKPLSEDEQLTFIENLWGHKIKSRGTEIRTSLKAFFNSLNTSTLSALHVAEGRKQNRNRRISSFMSVPLHSYMLAKVLTNDFIKFCLQNNDVTVDSNKIEEPFTIFGLYSRFFDVKFNEIMHNINVMDPKNVFFLEEKKVAETDHGKLALLEIFDTTLPTELVSSEDRITLTDSVNSGSEKIGIIAEVDNKPRFVHRTFAEYFAASHLAQLILSPVENKKKEAAKYLLYDSVTVNSEYYYTLFTFFNYGVVSSTKNKDIFEAAIGGNTRKLENENMAEMFDPLHRTPIHLIAFNLFNVLENFPNALPNTDNKDFKTARTMDNYFCNFVQQLFSTSRSSDKLFKWTLAHYLAVGPLIHKISLQYDVFIKYLNNVTQDSLGRTPLMLLILSDPLFTNNYIRRCLPRRLSGVDTQDFFSKTALQYVLERLEVCTIIEYISNQDIENYYDGVLTINYENRLIILLNYLEMICLLLKNGACIVIPNIQGTTPVNIIRRVITKESKYILKDLLTYKKLFLEEDRNDLEDTFLTPLNYITKYVDHFEYNPHSFYSADDGINAPDQMGRTALHHAVKLKNINAVRNLINKFGAQPDLTDRDGKRPVCINIQNLLEYIRARRQYKFYDQPYLKVPYSDVCTLWFIDELPPETAELLIGTTDLLTLSTDSNDHKDIVIFLLTATKTIARILLSKFPHLVDVVDSKGRTALHYAVKKRDIDCVTFLITRNARVDIPDNNGKMPAPIKKSDILYDNHNKSMLSFVNDLPFEVAKPLVLTMHLYPSITPDYLPFIFDQLRTIASVLWAEYSELLKATSLKEHVSYLDCNEVSNEVLCILLQIYCVEEFSDDAVKSNDILKLVVQLLASIKNNDLPRVQTVLSCVEYSLVRPNLANVNLLSGELNVAACVVNARSKDGDKTALHYVAQTGNADIAQCLLSHGAWYNAPDLHGTTPAQVARTHENTAVLHILDTVEVLSNCLRNKTYDIAQNVAMKEKNESNLFHCICFDTRMPLIHLALRQFDKNLLKSLIKCYKFDADFYNCRSQDGTTVIDVIDEMRLYVAEVLGSLELSNDLSNLITSSMKGS